jgi:amino acid permease
VPIGLCIDGVAVLINYCLIISAAAVLVSYWTDINGAAWISILMVLVIGINMMGARGVSVSFPTA